MKVIYIIISAKPTWVTYNIKLNKNLVQNPWVAYGKQSDSTQIEDTSNDLKQEPLTKIKLLFIRGKNGR